MTAAAQHGSSEDTQKTKDMTFAELKDGWESKSTISKIPIRKASTLLSPTGKDDNEKISSNLIRSFRPDDPNGTFKTVSNHRQEKASKGQLVTEINQAGKLLQQLSESLEAARMHSPSTSRRGSQIPILSRGSVFKT